MGCTWRVSVECVCFPPLNCQGLPFVLLFAVALCLAAVALFHSPPLCLGATPRDKRASTSFAHRSSGLQAQKKPSPGPPISSSVSTSPHHPLTPPSSHPLIPALPKHPFSASPFSYLLRFLLPCLGILTLYLICLVPLSPRVALQLSIPSPIGGSFVREGFRQGDREGGGCWERDEKVAPGPCACIGFRQEGAFLCFVLCVCVCARVLRWACAREDYASTSIFSTFGSETSNIFDTSSRRIAVAGAWRYSCQENRSDGKVWSGHTRHSRLELRRELLLVRALRVAVVVRDEHLRLDHAVGPLWCRGGGGESGKSAGTTDILACSTIP